MMRVIDLTYQKVNRWLLLSGSNIYLFECIVDNDCKSDLFLETAQEMFQKDESKAVDLFNDAVTVRRSGLKTSSPQ
jgi:hypothetical protein